jgi:polysaccharide biosynthesis/export protein
VKAFSIFLGCLLSGGGVAQTVAPVPSTYSEPFHIDSTPELDQLMHATQTVEPLQKGDLLKIGVYGADVLAERTRIAPDGTIDIPLAGNILLAGLTVEEAQNAITRLIKQQKLVLTPAVTVDVLESPGRVITIDGQVKNPGVYPAVGDAQVGSTGANSSSGIRTLGQLISLAGGLTETASNIVTLIRPSLPDPVSIPLNTDPNHQRYMALPLFGGDQIQVSHGGQAYVVGAVKKQGIIPLKDYSPTTVAQAIAISDGIGYEAAENDARLVRTIGTKHVVYTVQVRKIIQGKVPDIALQNGDILYVPTNEGKAALKGGAVGLIVALASTYIYAHP